MNTPLVTLCITAYDRPHRLKACLESFWMTNQYPRIELIIIDNASTNSELSCWIKEYDPPCENYKFHRRDDNDYPVGQKKSRVLARRFATGDYFIDCPDDHLFIISNGWIKKGIEKIAVAKQLADNIEIYKIGCIVHYAQPAYRYAKANNAMKSSPVVSAYYESLHKGYADYHLMAKSDYENIGEFTAELGFKCEGDYMQRAHALGYRRNILKMPVAIINDEKNPMQLVTPVLEYQFQDDHDLRMPVVNEELFAYALKYKNITPIMNDIIENNDVDIEDWLSS